MERERETKTLMDGEDVIARTCISNCFWRLNGLRVEGCFRRSLLIHPPMEALMGMMCLPNGAFRNEDWMAGGLAG